MCTLIINNIELDDENPWEGIKTLGMFTIWFTVYTITKYTLLQLVFGRVVILKINYESRW